MGLIIEIDDCTAAFRNAHDHILSRFENVKPSNKVLVTTWAQVFGVKIHRVPGIGNGYLVWKSIEFRDRDHFIEWYLKWT